MEMQGQATMRLLPGPRAISSNGLCFPTKSRRIGQDGGRCSRGESPALHENLALVAFAHSSESAPRVPPTIVHAPQIRMPLGTESTEANGATNPSQIGP